MQSKAWQTAPKIQNHPTSLQRNISRLDISHVPEQHLSRRYFSLVGVDSSNPLILLLISWTKSLPNQAEVNIFAPKGSMSHQHCCCLASLNTQTFCLFDWISVQKEDFYCDSLESSLSILSRQNKHRCFSQPSDSARGHKAAGSRLSEKVGGKCCTLKSKPISLIGHISLTFEKVYGWIERTLYFKKESRIRQSPVCPVLRFFIRTAANVAASQTTVTLTLALESYSAVSPNFSTHKFPLKGCCSKFRVTSEQPLKSGHPLC